MEKELLNSKDYLQILQRHLCVSSGIEVIKAEINDLSETIEGFMGDHFKLKIFYKKGDKESTGNYFIKTVTAKSKIQEEMASEVNAYGKEIYLYDYLFREFEKEKLYTGFAPKCYLAKGGTTIVLEDLLVNNFSLFGRRKFYDVPHCKAALKALASYHGASILYEEKKSKELNRKYRLNEEHPELYDEILYKKDDKDGLGYKFLQCSIDSFESVLNEIPESQEWRVNFINKIRNFDVGEDFSKEYPGRKTNGHGDLWSNNMLFKYSNGVPAECCLVDFQILRYHHPAYDVALVIESNTRKKFREENMDYLIKYYYECLKDILSEKGCDIDKILPFTDFKCTINWLEFLAKFQAFGTRGFVFLPAKVTSDAVNAGGDNIQQIIFDKRTYYLLESFNNDPFLREIIIEDIIDLKESLYRKDIHTEQLIYI